MVTMHVFNETPCAMGSGYSALVVIDDARIRGQVHLQALPVYAEIRTDAWIVRNSKIIIQKELVDWFHEEDFCY
jgi:hypothetical protein